MTRNSDNTLWHGNGDPTGLKVANGLGWFSIALGALELFATRGLTRSLGMRGNEPLVQLYGVREIATGIGILMSKDPTPWIWGCVVGDAVDTGTLAAHLNDENPEAANVAIALGNVAAVTAVDIYCAQKLSAAEPPVHDYSDRSGLPAVHAPIRKKGEAIAADGRVGRARSS